MPRDGHELKNWPALVLSPNRPNQGLNLANSGDSLHQRGSNYQRSTST